MNRREVQVETLLEVLEDIDPKLMALLINLRLHDGIVIIDGSFYSMTDQDTAANLPGLSKGLELSRRPQPLDYNSLFNTDAPVIFVGENHFEEGVFLDLARHAREIAASGINAVLLEAPAEQDFSALNAGDFSGIDHLVLGPDLSSMVNYAALSSDRKATLDEIGDTIKRARQGLVKALVSAGVSIFPIDEPWRPLRPAHERPPYNPVATLKEVNSREDVLSRNIIRYADEYGKVAVLIGSAHTKNEAVSLYMAPPDLPQHRPTGLLLTDVGVSHTTVIANTSDTELDHGRGSSDNGRYMYVDLDGRRHMVVPMTTDEVRIQNALGTENT